MDRQQHTLILLPHGSARSRRIRFTTRRLGIAAAIAVSLVAISAWSTWALFARTQDPGELQRLQKENKQLRELNAKFESNLQDMQTRLAEFEDRTRELAIVAGVDNLAQSPDPGVGGEEPEAVDATRPGSLARFESRAELLSGRLDTVSRRLQGQLKWIASAPAVAPVHGVITSGFGYRKDPMTGRRAFHSAVDIGSTPGHPVLAPGDGVVIRAGRIGRLGNAVYISHGYGITTRYGHLSRILVKPGEIVHRGEEIGDVGRTGRATGYHLHYEVRVDRRPVNPLGYMLDLGGG
jgi:murein DD-endopeptidase MepM/ murein hydrolase activator NlpD